MLSGKPTCRCGALLSELESPGLRQKWAEDEGLKWSWLSDRQAYFKCSEGCRRQLWPLDKKCPGARNRPGTVSLFNTHEGDRLRLIAGDFWLTASARQQRRSRVAIGWFRRGGSPEATSRAQTVGIGGKVLRRRAWPCRVVPLAVVSITYLFPIYYLFYYLIYYLYSFLQLPIPIS